jgi:hypothetical protein
MAVTPVSLERRGRGLCTIARCEEHGKVLLLEGAQVLDLRAEDGLAETDLAVVRVIADD